MVLIMSIVWFFKVLSLQKQLKQKDRIIESLNASLEHNVDQKSTSGKEDHGKIRGDRVFDD